MDISRKQILKSLLLASNFCGFASILIFVSSMFYSDVKLTHNFDYVTLLHVLLINIMYVLS